MNTSVKNNNVFDVLDGMITDTIYDSNIIQLMKIMLNDEIISEPEPEPESKSKSEPKPEPKFEPEPDPEPEPESHPEPE